MEWSIEYYSKDVEEAILSLQDGLLARYFQLTELMLEFGSDLGLPHTKAAKDGLFVLRVKSKEGIARIFYCTKKGKIIIILHVFIKKSQKIPKKELKIAYTRMKEVKKHEA